MGELTERKKKSVFNILSLCCHFCCRLLSLHLCQRPRTVLFLKKWGESIEHFFKLIIVTSSILVCLWFPCVKTDFWRRTRCWGCSRCKQMFWSMQISLCYQGSYDPQDTISCGSYQSSLKTEVLVCIYPFSFHSTKWMLLSGMLVANTSPESFPPSKPLSQEVTPARKLDPRLDFL